MEFLPVQTEIITSKNKDFLQSDRKFSPQQLVDLAIDTQITHAEKHAAAGGDEAFFVVDLGEVSRQHRRWKKDLPNIQPYYAVKCNSDPVLLKYLAGLNTGFDCASIDEMRSVLELGVHSNRILFANPCKSQSSLVFAQKAGILRTTFDNMDELDLIKAYMPGAQLLLRVYANDDTALIPLGEKYGAHLDTVKILLARVKELGLNLVGVSFHVGTGSSNPSSFLQAIKDARYAFLQAQQLGLCPSILDIGGGFEDSSFERIATSIRDVIASGFSSGITVIAEPGRFYARRAYTLACRVISRRRQMTSASAAGIPDMLYQNDGIYGNFMNVIMEKEVMVPKLVRSRKSLRPEPSYFQGHRGDHEVVYNYSIWGPTCDSIDRVVQETTFDSEVNIGDWLIYQNMGAYTISTSTQFNGFHGSHSKIYVNSEQILDY